MNFYVLFYTDLYKNVIVANIARVEGLRFTPKNICGLIAVSYEVLDQALLFRGLSNLAVYSLKTDEAILENGINRRYIVDLG